MSLAEMIWIGWALLAAYGLGRYIRYQQWSPTPTQPWRMEYDHDGLIWQFWAQQPADVKPYLGLALTYHAAVRRSRRYAVRQEQKTALTVLYEDQGHQR